MLFFNTFYSIFKLSQNPNPQKIRDESFSFSNEYFYEPLLTITYKKYSYSSNLPILAV